jgi:EipB-like
MAAGRTACLAGCSVLAIVTAAGAAGETAGSTSTVKLAPHRAIYEMKLGDSRSGSGVTDLSGRMVFEISGSACEGYTQNMRFVMETTNRDGVASTTDMSSSWEDGAAGRYRFTVSNYRDQEQTDSTAGNALRSTASSDKPPGDKSPGEKAADKSGGAEVKVELTKPAPAQLKLPGKVVFPVQHSMMLIDAAQANKSLIEADLYDGSEKGEKVYATAAVIGKAIKSEPASIKAKVKNAEKLTGLTSWPVAISYFDKAKEKEDSLPVYEIAFRYYANGVSENLVIDYGDFSINGALKEIEFHEAPKCEAK